MQTRRDVPRDERRLDHERARSAHGVIERCRANPPGAEQHRGGEGLTKRRLGHRLTVAAFVERRPRGIGAHGAHVVGHAHDEQLRGIIALFVIGRALYDGRAAHVSGECGRQPLRDGVRVIEPGFAARHAKSHSPAGWHPVCPANALGLVFELGKTRGAKFGHAYDHAGHGAQMQLRVGKRGLGGVEDQATVLCYGAGDAEGAEFGAGERLEPGRDDGERMVYHRR